MFCLFGGDWKCRGAKKFAFPFLHMASRNGLLAIGFSCLVISPLFAFPMVFRSFFVVSHRWKRVPHGGNLDQAVDCKVDYLREQLRVDGSQKTAEK